MKDDRCPSTETLGRLLRNELQTQQSVALIAHIGQCVSCENAVKDLPELGTLIPPPKGSPAAPPSTELAVGENIGCLTIERELGRGGMGKVYLVRNELDGRRSALKVASVSGELQGDIEVILMHRFKIEQDVLTILSSGYDGSPVRHPETAIQPFTSGVHERTDRDGRTERLSYYTMEFVEGWTLKEILANGPLPWQRAVGYIKTIAADLGRAHRAGILHRDLKPGNIIIRMDDRPVIIDWGLAKFRQDSASVAVGAVTTSGDLRTVGMLGTLAYMAPEQAKDGGAATERTDVYSLGAVFYHMLTGQPPFVGKRGDELLAAIQDKEVEWPSESQPAIPELIKGKCLRCLSKNASERFESPLDFASALAASVWEVRIGNALDIPAPKCLGILPQVVRGGVTLLCALGSLSCTIRTFGCNDHSAWERRSITSPPAVRSAIEYPKPRKTVSDLIGDFKSPDKKTRQAAYLALDKLGVRDWIKELNNPEEKTRQYAAEKLGTSGAAAKEAVPALLSALSDEQPKVAIRAAAAIARIEPEQSGTAVCYLLSVNRKSRDWSLVVQVLGELGPVAKEAVPQLIAELNEAIKTDEEEKESVYHKFFVDTRIVSYIEILGKIDSMSGESVPHLILK